MCGLSGEEKMMNGPQSATCSRNFFDCRILRRWNSVIYEGFSWRHVSQRERGQIGPICDSYGRWNMGHNWARSTAESWSSGRIHHNTSMHENLEVYLVWWPGTISNAHRIHLGPWVDGVLGMSVRTLNSHTCSIMKSIARDRPETFSWESLCSSSLAAKWNRASVNDVGRAACQCAPWIMCQSSFSLYVIGLLKWQPYVVRKHRRQRCDHNIRIVNFYSRS